jgi:hypothetical protein
MLPLSAMVIMMIHDLQMERGRGIDLKRAAIIRRRERGVALLF